MSYPDGSGPGLTSKGAGRCSNPWGERTAAPFKLVTIAVLAAQAKAAPFWCPEPPTCVQAREAYTRGVIAATVTLLFLLLAAVIFYTAPGSRKDEENIDMEIIDARMDSGERTR